MATQTLDDAKESWTVITDTASDHNYLQYCIGDAKYLRGEVEDLVGRITTTIQKACEEHLKRKNSDKRRVPWWDTELAVQRKKVRALRRRYQSSTTCQSERIARKCQYQREAAIFKRMLLTKKRNSWERFCETVSNQGAWQLPYRIAANKVATPSVVGNVTNSKGDAGKNMRSVIDNIVAGLFPQDDPGSDSPIQMKMRETVQQYLSDNDDTDFTETEVMQVIRSLASGKAPGVDGINLEIVREIHKVSPWLLTFLYNKCLRIGHFPVQWKVGQLILFSKPNKDPTSPKAYRPICLLTSMSKVLDKLLSQRIFYHLASRSMTNPRQYGFRPSKSCELAQYALRTKIQEHLKGRKGVNVISLDVAGAFDSVWYVAVLYYLVRADCPMNVFRLVNDYLRNRRLLYTSPAAHREYSMSRGCPQGSCSGPLFWNIVVDSLLDLPLGEGCCIQAYADDLTLVVWGENKGELEVRGNSALEKIRQWGSTHKLTFSSDKSASMPITYLRRLKYDDPPRFQLGRDEIKIVPSVKYLGVLWDKALTFHQHFLEVRTKVDVLTHRLSLIARKLYGNHPEIFRRIYLGAIERFAVYGHGAWGHRLRTKKFFSKYFNVVQRRPLVKMSLAYKTASTVALQVISVLPLDIAASIEYSKFLLHNNLEPSTDLVSGERNLHVEAQFNIWSVHPSQRLHFDHVLSEPDGDGIEIFTDGSGLNDQVEAALVACYYGAKTDEALFRLEDHNTVFQAEALALLKAAEWCLKLSTTSRVNIYTDSRSVLEALGNPDHKHPTIQGLKEALRLVQMEREVVLHWVKAHVGICGNELADDAAKRASELPQVTDPLPSSRRRIKWMLRDSGLRMWKERWHSNAKGRLTHQILPNPVLQLRVSDKQIVQLVTGHGRFPAYLQRFGIEENGSCECGGVGDALHYLTSCPRTRRFYSQLDTEHGLASLLKPKNLKILRSLMKFVDELTSANSNQ
ncbi:retrovirus-related Pol polyprotein from type-1 retrotransposable element R1 [Nephila pilipes]|uniref:Retrovirus-related Pol polyprotein from type-1 retrotransposable element R1 n=1 Tax=Nephila pilipes TaxID=299642 RepID=A0A8X6Q9W0_NEPPI|nr:retrovirus-related Pol polyprotein from type-1 retrotransposable element R1 [Nephila pilipes]